MILLGWLIFIAGGLIGWWTGVVSGSAVREMEKALHKKEIDVAWEEVKRLRAQVALHIGKDK